MRRTKRWTWAVMAWWALSALVANATPLMTEGGALVCSASGTKWVTTSTADASTDPQGTVTSSHTWHCSLCLPFVALAPDDLTWVAAAVPQAQGSVVSLYAWTPQPPRLYVARGPPLPLIVG